MALKILTVLDQLVNFILMEQSQPHLLNWRRIGGVFLAVAPYAADVGKPSAVELIYASSLTPS